MLPMHRLIPSEPLNANSYFLPQNQKQKVCSIIYWFVAYFDSMSMAETPITDPFIRYETTREPTTIANSTAFRYSPLFCETPRCHQLRFPKSATIRHSNANIHPGDGAATKLGVPRFHSAETPSLYSIH
jgi:hypothetical protein